MSEGDKILRTRLGITVLIICLILATIPTALCAKPYTTGQHKVITENDNGKTIYLNKGDIFSLKLKENPSTGYSWKLSLSKGLRSRHRTNYAQVSNGCLDFQDHNHQLKSNFMKNLHNLFCDSYLAWLRPYIPLRNLLKRI